MNRTRHHILLTIIATGIILIIANTTSYAQEKQIRGNISATDADYKRYPHPDVWGIDEPWLIDVIAPFGSVEEIVKDLKTNSSLAGKPTKMLGPKIRAEQGVIEF